MLFPFLTLLIEICKIIIIIIYNSEKMAIIFSLSGEVKITRTS